jgi:hypothetical protein
MRAMEPSMADRMSRLERANRRLLTVLVALVTLTGFLLIAGAVGGNAGSGSGANGVVTGDGGVIEARRIVLRDEKGRTRMLFQVSPKGASTVSVLDDKGHQRFSLNASAEGNTALSLSKATGAPGLSLAQRADGATIFLMGGEQQGLMLGTDPSGDGFIGIRQAGQKVIRKLQ